MVTAGSAGTAAQRVRELASRFGPVPFSDVVDLALYGEGVGFYETGGAAGGDARGGDFLTSPSIGPLFGTVIARALDSWWDELGRPDPYLVVEAGASTGELCRAIIDAGPDCAPALRYLLVERSERLRSKQTARLPIEPAAHVLGPVDPSGEDDDDDGTGVRVLPGGGPRFASLADLPASPVVGVVLANELLDNLPFAIVERSSDGWSEVRVTADLAEVLVPASTALASEADRLAPDAPVGGRIPIERRACEWLRAALRSVRRGRVMVVDYAVDHTADLATRPVAEWVRTYRGGAPGRAPLERLGEQDITVEVCIDQLGRVARPTSVRSQAEFLRAHGIDDLVEAARQSWQAEAAAGSLESLKARSRISEAEALTDPAGLGGFAVIEWVVA